MANCKIFMLATLNLSIAPADPYPSVKTRDAVTSMDLSSKDFSLNFRGFEHDDPETVKRFTAFCEANFALSPEQVTLLKSKPDTIVLTHGASLDELEAVAKVLREIGALVDVSPDQEGAFPSLLGAPSTQELHRLFGGHSDSSNDDTAPLCPYAPPLGRSLYLLSNSDAVVDRRALRRKMTERSGTTRDQTPTVVSSHRTILIFSFVTLGLGIAALTTAAILIKRDSNKEERTSSTFSQSRPVEGSRIEAPTKEDIAPRTLTSSTSAHGLDVDLKIIASNKAVSVSSLTFTPKDPAKTEDGITIKRIVGDPTFLSEISPGEWRGTVILSIFMEEDGIPSYFTTPADVEVRANADRSIAHASIRSRSSAPAGDRAVTITRIGSSTFEMSRILIEELTLS